MFCSKCGAQNSDTANFCSVCSNPLQAQQPISPVAPVMAPAQIPAAKPPRKTGTLKIVLATLACAAVFLVALILLLPDDQPAGETDQTTAAVTTADTTTPTAKPTAKPTTEPTTPTTTAALETTDPDEVFHLEILSKDVFDWQLADDAGKTEMVLQIQKLWSQLGETSEWVTVEPLQLKETIDTMIFVEDQAMVFETACIIADIDVTPYNEMLDP